MNIRNFIEGLNFLIDKHANGKHTVFAKKVAIPISTFQGYLNNRTPRIDHLLRIRETFHVNLDWLLTGYGSPYIDDTENKLSNEEAVLKATINLIEKAIMSDKLEIKLELKRKNWEDSEKP